MINHDEVLRLLVSTDSLVTDKMFEFNDFFDFGVHKATLRFDKFLSLFCRRVEEARIDLPKVL